MLLSPGIGENLERPHERATTPHFPAHEYSYRVPSPPHIAVPPPAVNSDGMPGLNSLLGGRADLEPSGFPHAEFLKTVTYKDFMITSSMMDWHYEHRRMAQKILPFLFLGPISAARDRDFLQREGITLLMAVRDTMSAQAKLLRSRPAVELGIPCLYVDVAGTQELIAAFPQAINAINAHLTKRSLEDETKNIGVSRKGIRVPGKVLVFCESGNERSATVVAAYLMAMFSLDLVSALQIVQAQRFCVSFDDSLRYLLQSYDVILRAKRDVAKHTLLEKIGNRTVSAGLSSSNMTKRNLDEAYEDDTEMEEIMMPADHERFERRESYAPFGDEVTI